MPDARFFNIGLPQLPLTLDPKIEPDLRDLYSALRNITYLLGQYNGFEVPEAAYQNIAGTDYTAGHYKRRIFREAKEALTYGQVVSVRDVGGAGYGAYLANATNNTRPCHGICNTLGVSAIGATVEIVLPGCYVTSIGGLIPGERYFLSVVNGVISNAPPVPPGSIRQPVGFALDTNILFFQPSLEWA